MNKNTSLVEGRAGKRLIAFSAPIILANLIQAIYGIVDMVVVGQYIGSAGMSAVSMGAQITAVVLVLATGLSNGGTVISAQLFGKGEHKALPSLVGTLLSFFAIAALILTALLMLLARPLLSAINTPDVAFEQAVSYFLICMAGTIFVYCYNGLSAILRGVGNSTAPMVIVFITVILNAVLDLLLVAVIPLGVVGAALATVFSQFISLLLTALYIKTKTHLFDFRPRSWRINGQFLKLVIKIGLPQSIQFFFASSSFVLLSGIVNLYGVNPSAAAGAAAKIQSLAHLPAQGVMAGIISLSAQNLAAGNPKRVMQGLGTGLVFAGLLSLIVCLLCIFFPTQAYRIFTSDEAVIAAGIDYLKVMSVSFILEGLMFCLFGVITGSGYTPVTMCCGILSAFIVRYVSAWVLCNIFSMGFLGVAVSYSIGPLPSIAICLIFILTGKWKTPRVQIH